MNEENEQKQLLLLVDAKLKEEFNIKCIRNKTTMADVLREYMVEYINNN